MICVNCGSRNVKIMVDITVAIPPKHIRKLSKKTFRSKDVDLLGVNWDRATVLCVDCSHSHKGV